MEAPQHAADGVRGAVHAPLTVFLPPYSPGFNPIELAFSKIKQALRSLGARTKSALWGAMQGILDQVTPSNAQAYFGDCGLHATKSVEAL